MALQQRTPGTVAECCRPFGRADDVGEQDRREHPVAAGRAAHACEEVLDLTAGRILISDPQRALTGKLDVAGVRHVISDVPRVTRVEDRLALSTQHQGRALHARQHITHVHLGDHRQRRRGAIRTHRQPLPARHQLPHLRIPTATGPRIGGRARAPQLDRRPNKRSALLETLRPLVPRVGPYSRNRRDQHQRAHQVGMGCREQRRQTEALGPAQQHRVLGADGVDHGSDVIDLLLQRRRPSETAGHPVPAPVEQDQPSERREPSLKRPEERHLPADLDVRRVRRHEHDVKRTAARDLIRDLRISAAHMTRLRNVHDETPNRGGWEGALGAPPPRRPTRLPARSRWPGSRSPSRSGPAIRPRARGSSRCSRRRRCERRARGVSPPPRPPVPLPRRR